MELCKHCSSPILSDTEDQVYCSHECWRAYRELQSSRSEPKESALMVWASIVGVLIALFALLMAVFLILGDSELGLPIFTFLSGVMVYFILKKVYSKEQITALFSIPDRSEAGRLILLILVLDIFVVLPIHVVVTLLVFPDAEQQEVITMFEEASETSIALLAFSVAILTPFAEELLFRGFILGMLMKRYENTTAIVISSLIFAIAHEPIAMGLAFGGGLLYGWVRVRTGSVIPGMMAHAIWNGFITIVVVFVLATIHI
ncbi:MAG TPA: CPBP family intramembrane metalloprotease [Candidatus Poseidoniales archaeon]|nr:CPBP family intramembrane metalloprotease [Candidatus Poseidoniales archaeon]